MSRKRILKDIQLDRIAAVDRPCQEGAVVTIMKRAEDAQTEADAAFAKRVGEVRQKILLAKAGIAMAGTIMLRKAWTDEARKKAAQARHMAGEHHRQAQHNERKSFSGSEDEAKKHGLAGMLHRHAARTYEEAEQHYHAGRMQEGDDTLNRATDVYASVANEYATKHKIMAKASADRVAGEARGQKFGPRTPRERGPGGRRPALRGDRGARRGRARFSRADRKRSLHGPRRLPGGERKKLLEARRWEKERRGHRQKLRHKVHRITMRGRVVHGASRARRSLKKDRLGIIQAKIAKSAILLARLDSEALIKVLGAGSKVSDYVHDFVNSSNKRFEGKSKQERIRMALGAAYSAGAGR